MNIYGVGLQKKEREIYGLGKVVVIGQAPCNGGDPTKPVTGAIGRRLAAVMGLGWPEEYLRFFDRANLIDEYLGSTTGKGDFFPLDRAMKAAGQSLSQLVGRRVLLLGRGVAKAYGLVRSKFLVWERMYRVDENFVWESPSSATWDDVRCPRADEILFSIFPHPSGINAIWNQKRNQERFTKFLCDLRRVTSEDRAALEAQTVHSARS